LEVAYGTLAALILCKFMYGDTMQAVVKWVDGAQFLGESGSGHAVLMDGPADHGGRNTGVRPMEMLLLGLGGCSSFDVMSMLTKARQAVSDCRCELEAERAEGVPSPFTKIHMKFVVTGKELKETQVKRAVELSATKSCSASIMLGAGGVEISHSYEIREA
jgi:putative redox protein